VTTPPHCTNNARTDEETKQRTVTAPTHVVGAVVEAAEGQREALLVALRRVVTPQIEIES